VKHRCAVLADFHYNMLEGIRGLLEVMFDAVVMVADMDSLLEAAQKLKPDIVVLDLSLQASGEVSVVKDFVHRFPGFSLVVLSVYDDPTVATSIIASGASGFVLKRAAVTDLLPALEEVFKGNTFISPAALRNIS
jgi:DNA-binding NarL/FixJ family response regulator